MNFQAAAATSFEYPFTPPPELTTGRIKRHDIVIVGAGLAGLDLACAFW